jgi:hypothetical protein
MTTSQEPRCQRCRYLATFCKCTQGPLLELLTPGQAAQASVDHESGGALLMSKEVARLFRVDSKTVIRWAKDGRIPREAIVLTLGGHRRYKSSFIQALLHRESP